MKRITIIIDPNASRQEVLTRLGQKLPVAGTRGRSTSLDHLRTLGASNLMDDSENWQEAQAYAQENSTVGGNAPCYAYPEQWSRSRAAARAATQTALDRLI